MATTENFIMYPTQRNGPHPTTCFGDPTVIFRNIGVMSAAPYTKLERCREDGESSGEIVLVLKCSFLIIGSVFI
jgi:hypothetical protein